MKKTITKNIFFGFAPLKITHALALVILCTSSNVQALPDDINQAMYLRANTAVFNQKTNAINYTGAVSVKQGSLKINADNLKIKTTNGVVSTVKATGTPATMQQQVLTANAQIGSSATGIANTIGQANIMTYNLQTGAFKLLNKAKFAQAGTQVTGNDISYNVKQSIFRARANNKQRIQIIIPSNSRLQPNR